MSVIYNVKVGESYKDANGADKTRWTTIGRVIKKAKGHSIKLDVVPLGWDGWASLFEPEQPEGARPATQTAKPPADDPNDEIPF